MGFFSDITVQGNVVNFRKWFFKLSRFGVLIFMLIFPFAVFFTKEDFGELGGYIFAQIFTIAIPITYFSMILRHWYNLSKLG